MAFAESEMYGPVKDFFEARGWRVSGEVLRADAVAEKDGKTAAIELKRGLTLKLIYQAIERQKAADTVYIAIGRFKSMRGGRARDAVALCRRLGVGLITVAMDSPIRFAELVAEPSEFPRPPSPSAKKRNALTSELAGRKAGANTGGVTRVKLITAYRERAIRVACALKRAGAARAAALQSEFGCPPDTASILRGNAYGWFRRVEKGVYALTEAGEAALSDPAWSRVAEYYLKNNADDNKTLDLCT